MNGLFKAGLQAVLSTLPAGAELNYAFQRYVTKNLPRPRDQVKAQVGLAERHLEWVRPHLQGPTSGAAFYEFGAGADLIVPLALYGLGVEHQTLVDIRRLARQFLVNATIRHLRAAFPERPWHELSGEVAGLTAYGIDYRAPCDARHTGLNTGTIDCITSTDTLEHIPARDIGAILKECRRLLRPDGVMSFQIDYGDHYSYFDPRISAYNFLRFSDRKWKALSPPLHYQNRLRHSDYVRAMGKAGFAILQAFLVEGSRDELASVPVDARFHSYEPADLAIRSSILLLKPRPRVLGGPVEHR